MSCNQDVADLEYHHLIIVIPIINSVTSVNLKKACLAIRNIVLQKPCTLLLISFAVAFGLPVFCS